MPSPPFGMSVDGEAIRGESKRSARRWATGTRATASEGRQASRRLSLGQGADSIEEGVVTAPSHAYIHPSLGNAIAAANARATRLLLSSVDFASFRAPIDSVMDPGGRPRRPSDPFLSLRGGFGPLRG